MRRTQIQLDEKTYEALRKKAFQENRSMADIIRSVLHERLDVSSEQTKRNSSAFAFVGSGRSQGKDSGDIAQRHDEALADAFEA